MPLRPIKSNTLDGGFIHIHATQRKGDSEPVWRGVSQQDSDELFRAYGYQSFRDSDYDRALACVSQAGFGFHYLHN